MAFYCPEKGVAILLLLFLYFLTTLSLEKYPSLKQNNVHFVKLQYACLACLKRLT